MHTQTIQSIIDDAVLNRLQQQQLKEWISNQTYAIHKSIDVPNLHREKILLSFALAYLEHVPIFFGTLKAAARKSGTYPTLLPALYLIEDYFAEASRCPGHKLATEQLMHAAYLSHRLFEEVNDHVCSVTGIPLISVDMITANLIAHDLVGDELGNRLDKVVQLLVDSIKQQNAVFETTEFLGLMEETEKYWNQCWLHWSERFDINNLQLSLNHHPRANQQPAYC